MHRTELPAQKDVDDGSDGGSDGDEHQTGALSTNSLLSPLEDRQTSVVRQTFNYYLSLSF